MNYKTLTIALLVSSLGTSAFAGFGDKEKTNELSPEATARWVTSWENTKHHKKYTFSTYFAQVNPSARDKKKHIHKGSVPFRITVDLLEIKESRGRMLRKRETGSAVIVLRDADGKDLLSKKISLAKLCPS